MSKVIDKAKQIVKVIRKAKINEKGEEEGDPRPVNIPIGFQKPPSIHELMQKYVRNEISRRSEEGGFESFEDAEDFDVDDDDTGS